MEKEKAQIIVKLARHRYWGGKHTSIDNLPKGAPRDRWNQIRKFIQDLINEEFLLVKPTKTGRHVSLNPKKNKEICGVIAEFNKSV